MTTAPTLDRPREAVAPSWSVFVTDGKYRGTRMMPHDARLPRPAGTEIPGALVCAAPALLAYAKLQHEFEEALRDGGYIAFMTKHGFATRREAEDHLRLLRAAAVREAMR